MKKLLLSFGFLLMQINPGFAQTITTLHNFNGTDGAFSRGNQLISDGNYFYGMTTFGGSNNKGTIFKIKMDGTEFQKLHDFNIENGSKPYCSLTLLGTQLFGTTAEGGSINRGVLFRINTDGSNYTKVIDFTGDNGDLPHSSLVFDGSFLYGSTYSGGSGSAGGGSIFKVRPDGTDFELIHIFNGSNTINGSQPNLNFVMDAVNSYLYGVTFLGGENNKGVIYKIKTDGSDFVKLHDFDGLNGDYSTSLMLLNDYLYASTLRGGTNEKGIIYKIKTDGTEFEKLHDFEQATGAQSYSNLIFMNDFLYGTAIQGGTGGAGVVFKVRMDGSEYSAVYAFNNESGYSPWSGMYSDGVDFYGINEGGGIHGSGTIYKFDPDGILAVNESDLFKEFNIYPNPAKDKLYVHLKNSDNTEVSIFDLTGKLIMIKAVNNSTLEFNIRHLKRGIYLVKADNKSLKFMKE